MTQAQSFPGRFTCPPPMLTTTAIVPTSMVLDGQGVWRIDFGRAWFGTMALRVTAAQAGMIQFHLGEKLTDDSRHDPDPATRRLDRQPPGSIRHRAVSLDLRTGTHAYQLAIPHDERNTGAGAILMPQAIGEVLPFRYVEIEGASAGQGVTVHADSVRLIAAHTPFDTQAATFRCSDETLNAVWDLCHHTLIATTFCGLYVDGDRERIPYEGDAYINQLGHYACEPNYLFARYTHEYLMQYPTWFTDWHLHSVLMAWMDYLYTGDATSLHCFYDDLIAKTLIDLADEDGLISLANGRMTPELERRLGLYHERYIVQAGLADLVDWPPGSFTQGGQGERDGHEMLPINTAVNALYHLALRRMAQIAQVVDRPADAARFTGAADRCAQAMRRKLFDARRGIYIDGMSLEGAPSTHASLHANLFPLAAGVVTPGQRDRVLGFIKSRGMACSVYGAQHLLEGLYDAGQADHALELLRSRGSRSWWAMIEAGSTMTLEAWGLAYKKNLDWNHAWGAAPANILPRKLMGIEPASPGFASVSVKPQVASLTWAHLRTPTPHGPITAEYHAEPRPTYVIDAPRQIELLPRQAGVRYVLNGREVSL